MPRSEYDPLFGDPAPADAAADADDFARVRERFEAASRAFLRSPWPWVAWSVLLPAAALLTPTFARAGGPAAVLLAWSGAILLGGAVEGGVILRNGRGTRVRSQLADWALGVQGNLSLTALIFSVLLLWLDRPGALPGVWLLLLGHSFYVLGGLSFRPMRTAGLLFQMGGAAALWPVFRPGYDPLLVFALATAAGCLWLAWGVARARAQP
jgi:hypothetical protein